MTGASPASIAWSAPGGSPGTGLGVTFSTSFVTAEARITARVTVPGGEESDSISISVQAPPPLVVECVPAPIFVAVVPVFRCSASGGTGNLSTVQWLASGGAPSQGTGPTFEFSLQGMPAGTYTVTATLGMQAASDTVTVTAPPQAPLEILSLTCDEVFLQGEFGPGAYEAVCTASLSAEATNWQWSPGLGSGLESWEVDASGRNGVARFLVPAAGCTIAYTLSVSGPGGSDYAEWGTPIVCIN